MDNRTRIYKSCRAALPGVTVVTKHAVRTQPVVKVRHHRAKTLSALASVHLVWLPTLATRATNQCGHTAATPRTRQARKWVVRTRAALPTQAVTVRHQGFRATIPTRLNPVNHEAGPSTGESEERGYSIVSSTSKSSLGISRGAFTHGAFWQCSHVPRAQRCPKKGEPVFS